MGISAGSRICFPGNCVYSDDESEIKCPSTFRCYSTDLMTPSAINAGSSWERAAKISQDISQDIKITVSLFKSDIDVSCFNKSSVSTNFKIVKAKELLLALRNGNYIDQRIRKKSGQLSGEKRQLPHSIRHFIKQKHPNKAKSEERIKSCSQDNSLETYDLTLPSWSDIWRLKCAVAQVSGIPARGQFLVCSNMTAETALEYNHPAASLSDLPVHSEQSNKPKSKPLPGMLSFNISGQEMSNTNDFTSSSGVPQSKHLNLVISIPRLSCWQMSYEKAPSIDCSDKSSQTGASFCLTSESSDRDQLELHSTVDLKTNLDWSERTSENELQVQPENCEMWKVGINPKKEPDEALLDSKSCGQSVGTSIEDFALEDLSDDEVGPCALKEKKEIDKANVISKEKKEVDQAEFVFLKMKMLSGKADLIQTMVALTRLGCERPTLAQARLFFESVECKITDCITPDHIRRFLQTPQQGEDSWLSNVRELMASTLCDPDPGK